MRSSENSDFWAVSEWELSKIVKSREKNSRKDSSQNLESQFPPGESRGGFIFPLLPWHQIFIRTVWRLISTYILIKFIFTVKFYNSFYFEVHMKYRGIFCYRSYNFKILELVKIVPEGLWGQIFRCCCSCWGSGLKSK